MVCLHLSTVDSFVYFSLHFAGIRSDIQFANHMVSVLILLPATAFRAFVLGIQRSVQGERCTVERVQTRELRGIPASGGAGDGRSLGIEACA